MRALTDSLQMCVSEDDDGCDELIQVQDNLEQKEMRRQLTSIIAH